MRRPSLRGGIHQRLRLLRQVRSQETICLWHGLLRGWQNHLRHLPDLHAKKVSASDLLHRPKVRLWPFFYSPDQ